MIAYAAASAFSPVLSSLSVVSVKASKSMGEGPESLGARGIVAKPRLSSRAMEIREQAQTLPKASSNMVGLKTEAQGLKEDAPSSTRTCHDKLPDWSFLFAAITTIFLAAAKQFTLTDRKPRRPEMLADAFGLGKMIQDGLVFRQNFSIRSYEIGADRTASIETLMNYLQETAVNHARCAGLMDGGFGSTPEMSKRNLIWVIAKMQVLVEKYPSWGDAVEVDTWMASSGKNGMRCDWHVHDCQTGQTVVKATSVLVLMNKQTRRVSKFPKEVRAEIGSLFTDRDPIIETRRKIPNLEENTADYVQKGLFPRWSDLDANQHVNNVRYIGLMLKSAPISILESHELRSLTLVYIKECGRDSVLQSLTAVSGADSADGSPEDGIECHHLLQMESGAEIMRGRTEWRPKRSPVSVLAPQVLQPSSL